MSGPSIKHPQGDRVPHNGFVSKRFYFPAINKPLLFVAGLTAVFLLFLLGYHIGRSDRQDSYSVVYQKDLPAETDGSLTIVTHSPAAKVNINTASEDELCVLEGIGPAIAKGIVEYRNANGDFIYSFDIMNVPGIGTAVYGRIRDFITSS
ncbi:MAG: ComEA family DNA-binding protein [Clostridiales bacterium]|nr:ComEA family DNA-binding protein [Clostridiales bacterium]